MLENHDDIRVSDFEKHRSLPRINHTSLCQVPLVAINMQALSDLPFFFP